MGLIITLSIVVACIALILWSCARRADHIINRFFGEFHGD